MRSRIILQGSDMTSINEDGKVVRRNVTWAKKVESPEQYMPSLLKSSIVSPIPKISPPASIEKDLRPISLTCTIAKLMESFVCNRLMPQLHNKIDSRQYSRKGHSTTDALLYMLQAIYEAVDSGEACARIFFADFSKGFD
ncbi:hypothetical protein AC249_AIPGENE6464 [Exaiptasia diaphana]|nr:hypothetical protein AC249_AIPGENE6464 [Exaiptasia diaphana]